MKNKTKKIVAIICLILVFITSLPLEAFAVFITDINSDAQFGVISGSLGRCGHELHYAKYDGTTYIMFCTQYGVNSPNGKEYVYNGEFIAKYQKDLPKYKKIAEMIYFGYTIDYGVGIPTTTSAYRAACCTQQYVWEYIHSNIDSSFSIPSRNGWNSTYMSASYYEAWLEDTEDYYNKYHGKPSFDGITKKATLGQTFTVNDTSKRLSEYEAFSQTVNGVTFSHIKRSNDLTITVSDDCTVNSVTFNSKDYGIYQTMPSGAVYDSSTMSNYVYIEFESGAIQDLMFSNYVDPSSFSINLQIESGNVLIEKTNKNGDVLAGCTFGLYSDANCTQLVATGASDSNGKINFTKLAPGNYYVKETRSSRGIFTRYNNKTSNSREWKNCYCKI